MVFILHYNYYYSCLYTHRIMLQSLNQNKLFQEIYLLLLGSKKVALTYEYDFRTADRVFSTGETKNIGKYLMKRLTAFL